VQVSLHGLADSPSNLTSRFCTLRYMPSAAATARPAPAGSIKPLQECNPKALR
jgi:hypothetical protein